MAFLLDTNVISELRKKHRCDPNVGRWQSGFAAESCYLSTITLMEIVHGIERKQKKDPPFAAILKAWYQHQFIPAFRKRTLGVTPTIAEATGKVMALLTRSTANCLLAGTALVHSLTLVTRNDSDFADTGVAVVNPWTG